MPIVEPEVLMDGAYTIDRAEEVTTASLRGVFAARLGLHRHARGGARGVIDVAVTPAELVYAASS